MLTTIATNYSGSSSQIVGTLESSLVLVAATYTLFYLASQSGFLAKNVLVLVALIFYFSLLTYSLFFFTLVLDSVAALNVFTEYGSSFFLFFIVVGVNLVYTVATKQSALEAALVNKLK